MLRNLKKNYILEYRKVFKYQAIMLFMVKANIETRDGSKIVVEGTEEEVASIIKLVQHKTQQSESSKTEGKKFTKSSGSKPSVADLVLSLSSEGFFDKPKTLAEIKTRLEEQGYFYPITTLSSIVLWLIKRRDLRRIKEGKKWAYVKA